MQAVSAKPNTFDYDKQYQAQPDIEDFRQHLEENYQNQTVAQNRDEMVDFVNQEGFTEPEKPLEEEEEIEIEKNIFHGISEFIKPVTDIWSKQPLMAPVISGIGAALHLVDGFAEMKGLPESTLKLTRAASIGYSKFITSMPNILDGIHRLKNNDYVEGLSRLFLLSKTKFGEPANFSMTNGAFTAFKTLKMFSKLENPKKFKSLGDNLKFLGKMFTTVLDESKKRFKEGGFVNTFDAISKVISTPMMFLSGTLGTILLGDEVDTPMARFFGALRNGFGFAADMSINIEATREAQKKAAAENRPVNPVKDILSSEEGLVGSAYSVLSLGELFQRYLPESVSKITAQLLCGIQEIATSGWGVYDSLKSKAAPKEEMSFEPQLQMA
ncbi:MAG: hypothetical protein HRT47_13045 [Candidatus Caenarcaniphilales bacterium]|nr:hypothetical protein [Candidatus Caenarcaniphilales bacterium]